MPDVKGLLNRIWSQFRSVGVSNEDQIVEHLAALLTEDYERAASVDLQLRKPTERGDPYLDEINKWLSEAIDAVDETLDIKGKRAALFDRYILFQFQQIRNGYYPTPRHIAQYMRHLLQLRKEHTLIDFACGSGGLLVEREYPDQQPQEIIGIDISPDWAKLAWANTRLHGETSATIFVKDALRAAKEELRGRTFARILMNPPFGGAVNAQLAREVVGETTSDSTVVLTALALQALAPKGYAAILVPNGILFSGASGATRIRDLLTGQDKDGNYHGNFDLKAVISLPPDALKPFSAIPTHILLIQKRKADQETPQQNITWFFRPTDDGYKESNRRDVLTTRPKEPNELTLVEYALQRFNNEQVNDLHLPEDNPLLILKNITLESMPPAILIEAINGAVVSHVTYCPSRETVPGFFLIEFTRQSDERGTYYIQIPIDQSGNIQTQPMGKGYSLLKDAKGRQELLKTLYNVQSDKDVPLTGTLLDQERYARAITITNGNGLLGVAVSTRGIIPGNLQPVQYVKALSEMRESEAPAILLGRVRRKQAAFLQQVDGLLGRLDLPAITKTELPSPLAQERGPLTDQEQAISPFVDISSEQLKVWQRICSVADKHEGKNGLFTLRDIASDGIEEEQARLAMELFEWMGVVVPVTVMNPNTRESIKTPLYRRVTERDLWK